MDEQQGLPDYYKKGLEDIIAAESKICKIDGKNGRLWYRGYKIEDLAANCTFEEVTYLLLYSKLPTKKELKDFTKQLAGMRKLPKYLVKILKDVTHKTTPMEALRTATSALAGGDEDIENITSDYHLAAGLSMIAKFPTIIAFYHRINNNLPLIKPKKNLGHAANFLYMLTGTEPNEIEAKALDMDFVLHAEHGFNASTFAVRTTVSTLSDMYSALTTGVGVLKGPLHGGAAEAGMAQLKNIGTVANAEPYVMDKLAKHDKIMGIGHRVYKTIDPRAVILENEAKKFSEAEGDMKWFDISQKIEEVMLKQKGLYPNVDFFSPIVYAGLKLPMELDGPIFAIARTAGWVAHAMEQYDDNRLIRPIEYYTGPIDLEFVPIEKRK